MRFRVFCFLIFCAYSVEPLFSQEAKRDSLEVAVGLGTIVSSEDFAPFFLVHNRWGEVSDEQTVFASGELSYNYRLNKNWRFESGFSFRNEIFSSYYLAANYDVFYLRVGAYKEQLGGLASDLTVVNYGLGRNARPVPMIELGMHDYMDIPFTQGYLQFKAHIGQRWLEEDRYISNTRMHNKDLYVRINLEREIGLTVGAGLVHFAQYGGTDPFGQEQPSSFDDFLKVFFGRGIPNEFGGTAGEANALGNHLGMTDVDIQKSFGDHKLNFNFQTPFDDSGSLHMISFKNYLAAFQWILPNKEGFFQEVMVEYTKSKRQSGPGLPDPVPQFPDVAANQGREFGGRDDFHNNYLYRSGFSYDGRSLGNALFLTYDWTRNFLDYYPDYNVMFSNNRINAFTIGVKGALSSIIDYKLQVVYSQNYGTYAGLYDGRYNWGGVAISPGFDYVFSGGKDQYYSLLDLKFKRPFKSHPIDVGVKVAFDTGELYSNVGGELTFSYIFTKH